jgi:hypothetical protein
MLEEFLLPISHAMLFNQVGQLPHFHKELTHILNLFPDKWIATDEPTTWTPHSLDLTTFNVFFWGYINDAKYVLSLAATFCYLLGG